MKRIYLGPKQSTIENSNFFDHSITLFGITGEHNDSYESFLTFEYWNPDNALKEITIYNRLLSKIEYQAEVIAHNPLLASKCKFTDNLHLVCLNDLNLLNTLNNKSKTHDLFKGIVPMLQYYSVKGESFKYTDFSNISNTLVIQHPTGSGGSKTFFCTNENYEQIEQLLIANENYIVSAYVKENIPYNIHCIIGNDQIELLPPSMQELEIIDKIEYIGSDYNLNLSKELKEKFITYCIKICKKLHQLSYRGVLGIDFIYANEELYFIEINPRFQGSTKQIDKILMDNKLPSIFEYNYNSFKNITMPSIKFDTHSLFN